MSFADLLGIDVDNLDVVVPVENRHLQLDADFPCYECANVNEPLQKAKDALVDYIEMARTQARAEHVNCHLTIGMKGGREQMATVKPYQAQRKRDPILTRRVAELRQFLRHYTTDTVTPIPNFLQEADDSLTQYQLARREQFGNDASVLQSGDKDLRMVAGLHRNSKTGEFIDVSGYGWTDYKDVGNKEPKLIGYGTSWFWHQLLMGDTADNIAGLPDAPKQFRARYGIRNGRGFGEKAAVAVLKGCVSDNMAVTRVLEAYRSHWGVDAIEMLVEQAFLLWMRRKNDLKDILYFLKDVGLDVTFSPAQIERLKEFQRLAAIQLRNI